MNGVLSTRIGFLPVRANSSSQCTLRAIQCVHPVKSLSTSHLAYSVWWVRCVSGSVRPTSFSHLSGNFLRLACAPLSALAGDCGESSTSRQLVSARIVRSSCRTAAVARSSPFSATYGRLTPVQQFIFQANVDLRRGLSPHKSAIPSVFAAGTTVLAMHLPIQFRDKDLDARHLNTHAPSWHRFVPSKLLALWRGTKESASAPPSRTWHEITAEASQTADPNRVKQLADELLRLYEAERNPSSADESLVEEDSK